MSNQTPRWCSYDTYTWDARNRRAVDRQRVVRPYSRLQPKELDAASGCSICREDQVLISLPGVQPFYLCRVYADRVRTVLSAMIKRGIRIHTVIGYRVGKTRGDVDVRGWRTRYSNHSFGIAIDINPQQNGLYDNCLLFSRHCRLIRGGHWRPGQPGSLEADGELVRAMRALGFRWGGRITGKQKDFMHFSPSGY